MLYVAHVNCKKNNLLWSIQFPFNSSSHLQFRFIFIIELELELNSYFVRYYYVECTDFMYDSLQVLYIIMLFK